MEDSAVGLIDCLHEWQAEQGQTDTTMLTVAIEVLAHATRAIAEQARIANLLTAATAEVNLLNPLAEGHQYSPVFTAIREGLDI